jgi:hypothetical protein
LSLLAAALACAVLALGSPSNAVVDGQPDGNQHPNVGLIFGFDTDGAVVYSCTGTLVDPTTVLSAAHCVGGLDFGVPIAQLVITFDNHLEQWPDGSYRIDRYVAGTGDFDPGYQDLPSSGGSGSSAFLATAAHDIGLLHLAQRADTVFPGIEPAPIAGAGTNEQYRTGPGKDLVLQVGYGSQSIGPPGQPSSRFIDYTRNQALVRPKKLTETLLFLGSSPRDAHGYGSPCFGDSGSPVFRDGEVISLFTFAQFNCQNAGGGARLDAGPARDFLRSKGLVP